MWRGLEGVEMSFMFGVKGLSGVDGLTFLRDGGPEEQGMEHEGSGDQAGMTGPAYLSPTRHGQGAGEGEAKPGAMRSDSEPFRAF